MLLKNIPLIKSDFEEIEWEEIIKDSKNRECFYYSPLFYSKAYEIEANVDEAKSELFTLLGAITSLILKPGSNSEPFAPAFVTHDSRSPTIDDIYDEHLIFLGEIVHDIIDPEIRARIADILWVRKRDYHMAELAINSYLESATNLEDIEQWPNCYDRIERAFRLGASLGKNSGFLNIVVLHIKTVLNKYNVDDPKYLSQKLMGLLIDKRLGDYKKYSALSEKLAKNAELNGDWRRARTYWETKAHWHTLDTDDTNEKGALIQAAETYVKEADAALEREQPSYMIASAHIQHAIEAYRRIGGETERVDDLHSTLLEYQERSINELKTVSTEIKLDVHAKRAIAQIKGKTLHDAIFQLALLGASPEVNNLKKQVQELVKEYPIQHILPIVGINEKGRATGIMPNLFSDDPKEAEEALQANMFKHARYHHTTYVEGIIEPARNQINLEHNIRINDFIPIVSNNPFIPAGRELIFAQGLHAGMEGDFIAVAHLLIPQIENSIRHVLTQHGVITSGIDSEGIQDERSLNITLHLSEMNEIFGEDIIFDLQGLLVERFGYNLRNLMAHGLISYKAFFSFPVIYLWWLILRLCCLPILMKIQENPTKDKIDNEFVENTDDHK
jgi:hypothetical protein